MVPRPREKNPVLSMLRDGEKSTRQENYIRMRTPQEGFIGVDLNFLRLKFQDSKKPITCLEVWFKKSFRHCKCSRHSKFFELATYYMQSKCQIVMNFEIL